MTREHAHDDAALRLGMLEVERICTSEYDSLQELAIEADVRRHVKIHDRNRPERAWCKAKRYEMGFEHRRRVTRLTMWTGFCLFLFLLTVNVLYKTLWLGDPTLFFDYSLLYAVALPLFLLLVPTMFAVQEVRYRNALRKWDAKSEEDARNHEASLRRDPLLSEKAVRTYLTSMLSDLQVTNVTGEQSPMQTRLSALRGIRDRLVSAKTDAETKMAVADEGRVVAQYELLIAPMGDKLTEVNETIAAIEAEQERLIKGIAGYRALIEQRMDPIRFAAEYADIIGQADEAIIRAKHATIEAFDAVCAKLLDMERHIVRIAQDDVILTEGCDPEKDFDFRLSLACGTSADAVVLREDEEVETPPNEPETAESNDAETEAVETSLVDHAPDWWREQQATNS